MRTLLSICFALFISTLEVEANVKNCKYFRKQINFALVSILTKIISISSYISVCYINNGTVKPQEEKLVAVIPTFMPNFNIYLKVSNIRIQSGGWHNLFQVTKPGTNHWNQPGNRMASIYFKKDYFHICTDRSGKSNKCINKKVPKTSQDGDTKVFEGPFHFQFIQKENENGEYVQTITLNGETLVNEVNTDPKSVEDAELYMAVKKPHNYIPLNAEIEDFKLQTGKNNLISIQIKC